jgi:bifunctional non-homologous end joining protein LigD
MHGKSAADKAWLLIKADDEYADRDRDIRDEDKSAASGRSLSEIAGNGDTAVWLSNDNPGARDIFRDVPQKVLPAVQEAMQENAGPGQAASGKPAQTKSRAAVSKASVKTAAVKKAPAKKVSATTADTARTFGKEAPASSGMTLRIANRTVAVSNPGRIYFPELKLTKLDIIGYYREVATFLLPYLKDRPFVLHRFPRGIQHTGFYQKDNPQDLPPWIKSAAIHSESTGEDVRYLLCQNEATLVYLVNLGCLEMHPWSSRLRHIDKPDWMIFDLDPVDIGFAKVVEVAQAIHALFAASDIPHFCKTSGKRGLHVAVPLGAKYANDTVKEMALSIAQLVHQELPGITSLERSPAKRRKKVYLDYLQNGLGKTLAAPYSLRPVEYAGVSTPLHWDEVNAKLDPTKFTLQTIPARLNSEGDLWSGVLTEAIDLRALIKS